MNPYAVTRFPTPLFNTPDLSSCFGGSNGDSLPLDEQKLLRAVETILFPGSSVKLLKQMTQPFIWQVETEEYPYLQDLFLDVRFVTPEKYPHTKRQAVLPSSSVILKTLGQLENTRYIWGGNWPEGIDLLPTLYPSKTQLDKLDSLVKDTWLLKGVDCSGLLHYATNGWTPRNTSSLVHFGQPVDIEGKGAALILEQLQELDIIAWEGHAIYALNNKTTIESKPFEGVVKMDSAARLAEVMKERRPVNHWNALDKSTFVVRRWCSN